MRNFSAILLFLLPALVFSCTKSDGPSEDYVDITSSTELSMPAAGYSETVVFKAGGPWSVSVSDAAAWISVYPDHGTGDGSFILAATANPGSEERSASVKIVSGSASETVAVKQAGAAPHKVYSYAELPVLDKSDANCCFGTLYANTVNSKKRVRNYSFCYDTRRHNPVWVAFPMHSIYAEGKGRSKDEAGNDPWMQYPGLDIKDQSIIWDIGGDGYMYWSASSSILSGGSWTKGHLCMSSSRAGAGSELNLQTFYPVNIAPQSNAYAGAGIFGNLWSKTEDLHWQYGSQVCPDTLYVVAGCYYANDDNIEYDACSWNSLSTYSKACVMPTHQYKILLRTKGGNTGKKVQECSASELKAIGFWFDSVLPTGASESISDYALSVADIEKRTGITFFPDIPSEVKKEFSTSFWGL